MLTRKTLVRLVLLSIWSTQVGCSAGQPPNGGGIGHSLSAVNSGENSGETGDEASAAAPVSATPASENSNDGKSSDANPTTPIEQATPTAPDSPVVQAPPHKKNIADAADAADAANDKVADGQAHSTNTDLGGFRNTYYYLSKENDDADQRITPVRGMNGEIFGYVTPRYKKSLDMEGSGKLDDGTVVNFAGRLDGENRYETTVHPFGRGVGDCELVPFHSIAVDPHRIPYGSWVYIAKTDGMKLPDGSAHNGLWQAVDTGSAIKGDRIDLFIGLYAYRGVLDDAHIDNMESLSVKLVTPADPHGCHKQSPR